MKKLKLLLFILSINLGFVAFAESTITHGDAIDFQSGLVGSFWHPLLNIAQYDSNEDPNLHLDLFTVVMKTSDTYYSYPDESKLLLKFSDDSVIELDSFGDVIKDYQCTTLSKHPQDVYFTGRNYILTEEDLQKILTLPIIKVRIELSNGNRKDYEVGEKHGKKVLKKIQESYDKVTAIQAKRRLNVSSDLKDDF